MARGLTAALGASLMFSVEYDDANHRLVMRRTSGGLSCSPSYTTTITYDDDGLLVSEAYVFDEPQPPPEQIVEYTTFETGEICSD